MTGSYFYKKIILLVALFAFCVSGFFPVQRVEAEGLYTVSTSASPSNSNNATIVGGGSNKTVTTAQNGNTKIQDSKGNTTAEYKAVAQNSEIACWSITKGMDVPACISIVTFAILGLCSWILWLSAIFFNAVINYSLNMASVVNDIPIVALGWTTFRDVANLCFIFIILYIGISMILQHGGFGSRKTLINVIIGAMLINFSLFFTQVAIDASNIIALQFYHKIINVAQTTVKGTANAGDMDAGISAAFTRALGMENILSIGGQSSTQTANGGASSLGIDQAGKLGFNSTNLLIASIGGIILVLITAFVFFAGGIMMLVRTVVLIFLMILSPFAFLGKVLPAVGEHTGKWWKKLNSNLMFAPAYMALMYLVISIIGGSTDGKFTGVTIEGKKYAGTFIDAFSGGTDGAIGAIMTFAVLIALMVGCLIVASTAGAEFGGYWEKKGKGLAKDWSMRFTGANSGIGFARNAVGWAGTGISESKTLARVASRLPLGGLGAAALMQQGKKMKDWKIGGEKGKSFNDVVKEKTKVYSDRGNMIEGALKGTAGKAAEERYLNQRTFSYASKTAIGKAKKKSSAPKNKEALEALIKEPDRNASGNYVANTGGKFSKANHDAAKARIEGGGGVAGIDSQITAIRQRIMGLDPRHDSAQIQALVSQESSLRGLKADNQAIIKGYEDTVDKLDRIERSESKDK